MELSERMMKLMREADDLVEEGKSIIEAGLFDADGIDSGAFSSLKWRHEQWQIRWRELQRDIERGEKLAEAGENIARSMTHEEVQDFRERTISGARLRVVK